MDCLSLIRTAREAGLRITTDGTQLSIRGPKRWKDLAQELLAKKSEVINILLLEHQKCCPSRTSRDTSKASVRDRCSIECPTDSGSDLVQTSIQRAQPKAPSTQLTVDTTDISDTTALAPDAWQPDKAPVNRTVMIGALRGPGIVDSLASAPDKVVATHPADREAADTHGTPLDPALRRRLEASAARLDGVKLFDLAHDAEISSAERALYRDQVLIRADRLIAESEDRELRPNSGVWVLLEKARARLGVRAAAERSLTVWLRRHRPEVAEQWPESPVDASWLGWRNHVGPEHVAALDAAFADVTAQSIAKEVCPTHRRPAAERRRP